MRIMLLPGTRGQLPRGRMESAAGELALRPLLGPAWWSQRNLLCDQSQGWTILYAFQCESASQFYKCIYMCVCVCVYLIFKINRQS